ncbi:MAG TPA: hypothetical protein VN957_27320 [Chthoniobacterales bacterium]|nr:hypothetical protein [Chthoniobacterales bacterium]
MPISTTVARNNFNTGWYGTINLRVASTAGILTSTPLTVGGDLVLQPVHELPSSAWKCEVIATPRGSDRLIIRTGDTVTG